MKKIVLINGTIAGIITALMFIITIATGYSGEGGMVLGYASMLLAFSLVFTGIKSYRDKYGNGFVSFGKAFKIGLFIVLLASTIYVLVWEVEYFFFIPDFAEKYGAQTIEKLKAGGATAAEVEEARKKAAEFAAMYKNPLINALMTYMEILPVGLIVTLISALILKKKDPQPSLA